MRPSQPKILLLYKISTYAYYFNANRRDAKHPVPVKSMVRFKKTHLQHYKTLVQVEEFLRKQNIRYSRSRRGQKIDFSKFDFVITVGGDGTFLEAARYCTNQVILGINSDPGWSVGRFCAANDKTFPKLLEDMFNKKTPIRNLNRLKLRIPARGGSAPGGKGRPEAVNVLNDALVCHVNPAAMSRYMLQINGKMEEQRSSGVWIAPAAGSTGAILSAGSKILPVSSEQWQYKPRELYGGYHQKYRFKGGVLSPQQSLNITSLMNNGVVYVDGSHLQYLLRFGEEVIFKKSDEPLKVVMP